MKIRGEVARKVSDRHFGIGSDGLILIKPSLEADFEMDMYNSDGSQGAMCGNGIRCVAKYVYDYGLTDKDEVSIATKSGIKYVKLQVENGKAKSVCVDMGAPILNAGLIPIVSENPQVINEAITAGGREYRMTGVSMGNPHAVVYIDDVKGLDIEKIGPLFETHPCFPDRVNTEFSRVLDDHTVEMRVWERGAGETLACGTGGMCGGGGIHFKWLCGKRSAGDHQTARRRSGDFLGSAEKYGFYDGPCGSRVRWRN